MNRLYTTLLLVLAAGCASTPEAQHPFPANSMAVTAHPLATTAARDVLARGGNAADAAVAAGMMLAVVEPSMSHLGGRTQILVRAPDGTYQGYNGMTEVPASYIAPDEPVSQGYGTIATPGVVAALGRLHAEHGTLSWSALLQEPARVAADGFALLPGAAARHATGLELFSDNPGFQQTFIKEDGSTYAAGDVLKQPVLADTIARLAGAGADDFYSGKIAQQIAADMAANGGYVTTEDLAAYEVLDGRNVTTNYRGFDVHSLAAPAGGGLVIKTLNILENFELAAMTDVQWAAVMNQALALAINSMDEDRAESDLDRVEDKAWAAQQAAGIRVPAALPLQSALTATARSAGHDWSGSYWGQDSHHTSHFTIADCDGRVVSITQTVGPSFGSRVITPGLGFVYAATMGSYLSAIDQVPGSRPRTTIAPTVVTRNGEVVLALGAAGGMRILSAIVQTISRYVDQGHAPDVAVALPRVHPVRSDTESGEYTIFGEQINFEMTPERGWPPEVAESLRAAGFEVVPVETHASFGRVHLVARSGDAWQGVADADWEGTAMSSSCHAH